MDNWKNMDYYCFSFQVQAGLEDAMIAFIADMPFDTFDTQEGLVKAYLRADHYSARLIEELNQLNLPFLQSFDEQRIPYQNWNAVWESNFQPIQVGQFCGVRADFHPSFQGITTHEIIINPEMAFGTGHHATTHMMIQLMERLSFDHKKVLDYGCGTGILAILAAKMGADPIDAVDIEYPAYENTLQNARLNQVSQINVVHGTLNDIHDKNYDLVLANINRNVILDSLSALYNQMSANGNLLISGILQGDMELIKQQAQLAGFNFNQHLNRGEWVALLLNK